MSTAPRSSNPRSAATDSAPPRNRLSRAVRAAVAELFGLQEPPAAPAGPRRVARAAYHGAEVTRFNLDWRTSNEAADDDIRGSMLRLRGRARDLARNNPYIKRFLGLLVSNVIGSDGVGHQAQVRFRRPDGSTGELNEPINDVIEAAWRDWCRGPVTVDGKLSMLSFQCLQLKTAAFDGEAFTRTFVGRQFRHGIGLQPIDPDLVAESYDWRMGQGESEIRLGVEVDPFGRPMAYHVWDWPQYMPGRRQGGMQRISADEMFHHYRMERAHQTRGVSWVAPTMQDIQDLAGYDEAVILGARAGANQMAFAQWKDPAAAPPPPANDEEARKPLNLELNPATITEVDPGLEVVPFDPKQPSGVYAEFVKTVLRRIASGLDLDYSSLANDLREVNYSSTKVGKLVERELWKMLQEWWVEVFVQPLYERWLEAALLSGALRLPGADWREYSAVTWTPRRWPWIEPQREIGATKDMIAIGLTSRQRVLAEQSDGDFRKIAEELAQEAEIAAEAGVDISGASPSAPAPAPTDAPEDTGGDEPQGGESAGEAEDGDEADAGASSRGRTAAPANRLAALGRRGRPAVNGYAD